MRCNHGYPAARRPLHGERLAAIAGARGLPPQGRQADPGGLLRTLQSLKQLPVHVGGRFALARQSHEHYLHLGESATVTLYGPAKLPARGCKLPLRERVQACGSRPFDWPPLSFSADRLDATLNAQGIRAARVRARRLNRTDCHRPRSLHDVQQPVAPLHRHLPGPRLAPLTRRTEFPSGRSARRHRRLTQANG